MLAALATTLARESRTSLGDPSSRTCRAAPRGRGAGRRPVVRRGDLGVPVPPRRGRASPPGRRREGTERPDDRVDVVAHRQQHQPPVGAERRLGRDGGRELAVGDRRPPSTSATAPGTPPSRSSTRPGRRTEIGVVVIGPPPRRRGPRRRRAARPRSRARVRPRRGAGRHLVTGLDPDPDRGVVPEVADVDDLGGRAVGVRGQHLHLLGADGDADRTGLAGPRTGNTPSAHSTVRSRPPSPAAATRGRRSPRRPHRPARGRRPAEIDLGEGPPAHHRHLVGQRERLALVVGDEHRGGAGRTEGADDRAAGLLAEPGVERGERLVEQHQRGLGGQGAGQRDALLLTAGELVRLPVARDVGSSTRSSTSATRDPAAGPRRGRGAARRRCWRRPQVREQRALLRHVADGAPPRRHRPAVPDDGRARHGDGAGVGVTKPATTRSSVVLPQPDGPRIAVTPSWTTRSRPRSTRCAPNDSPRPRISSAVTTRSPSRAG